MKELGSGAGGDEAVVLTYLPTLPMDSTICLQPQRSMDPDWYSHLGSNAVETSSRGVPVTRCKIV